MAGGLEGQNISNVMRNRSRYTEPYLRCFKLSTKRLS